MQRHAAPSSSLPRFMIPCPHCGGRMIVTSIEATPLKPDCEDITHGCISCGSELTRMFRPERRGPERMHRGLSQ